MKPQRAGRSYQYGRFATARLLRPCGEITNGTACVGGCCRHASGSTTYAKAGVPLQPWYRSLQTRIEPRIALMLVRSACRSACVAGWPIQLIVVAASRAAVACGGSTPV